ncbi:preprotein translocase subunit TatB [Methylobacterium variabile]|jgi:tRNA 2-thiouridine synthesizing protein A|uniref:Preprotein translocase subunit TatB n=1 Tax=Methylobacterium variabile TaxID=298794 RepID=A0A0J6S8G3_9HYPH|nr:sulfurtransferase TusA family protein [Methylobacterium variabile]KMO29683.1 preprotein translocase subunit TatB [Methylobacterium variabile]
MQRHDLDLRGLKCPLPVLRTRKALRGLEPGESLAVRCTDPMAAIDIPNLLRESGDHLDRVLKDDGVLTFEIRRGAKRGGDDQDHDEESAA